MQEFSTTGEDPSVFSSLRRLISDDTDYLAAAAAGGIAGVAFLATMAVELKLSGRKLDDLILLGSTFTKNPDNARKVGLAIHAVNSVGLGTLYAAVAHDIIPELHAAIERLTQFHDTFAADLSERLFRESSAGGT